MPRSPDDDGQFPLSRGFLIWLNKNVCSDDWPQCEGHVQSFLTLMYLLCSCSRRRGFLFPPPVKDFEAFDTSVCVCVPVQRAHLWVFVCCACTLATHQVISFFFTHFYLTQTGAQWTFLPLPLLAHSHWLNFNLILLDLFFLILYNES